MEGRISINDIFGHAWVRSFERKLNKQDVQGEDEFDLFKKSIGSRQSRRTEESGVGKPSLLPNKNHDLLEEVLNKVVSKPKKKEKRKENMKKMEELEENFFESKSKGKNNRDSDKLVKKVCKGEKITRHVANN